MAMRQVSLRHPRHRRGVDLDLGIEALQMPSAQVAHLQCGLRERGGCFERLPQPFELTLTEPLEELAYRLHVLLRRRLLREPGGFEGLLGLEVSRNDKRLAVRKLDH
jgi:hypothetical protein